jgi:lipoate---protein ligase
MTLLPHLSAARRLPWASEPASAQLASSSALLAGLEQTGVPALRWYRIDPPALLLGSSQRLSEADLAACAVAGVSVHRRGSGGGVVLSHDLLLLDLALPRTHPLFLDDVTESYSWLGEVWATALRDLGLPARTISIDEARTDTQASDPLLKRVCFGGRSPYEVVVEQSKVVGLAQIRRRGGALLQAGIHLRWQPQHTAALLAVPASERSGLAKRLVERVAGLDDFFTRPPDVAEVMAHIEARLEQLAGMALAGDTWNDRELAARSADAARYVALTEACL